MTEPPRKRPLKDERDEMIDRDAKNWSLELVICATQILTVICAIKGNSAWKGSLSLLFFGAGTGLIYKYRMYREKPYLYVGLACLIIGAALLIWFARQDERTGGMRLPSALIIEVYFLAYEGCCPYAEDIF